MAQRDIVVRRVRGARAVMPPLGAPLIIPAVICRTFGKSTSDEFSLTRNYGTTLPYKYVDRITTTSGAKLPINSILSAKWDYEYATGKTMTYEYKAGIHFRVAKIDTDDKPVEYLDHERLYIEELPSSGDGYGLDWSQAPLLSTPQFKVDIGTTTGTGIPASTYEVHVYATSNEPYGVGKNCKGSMTVPQKVEVVGTKKALIITWQGVAYATGYVVKVYDVSNPQQPVLKFAERKDPDVFVVVIEQFPDSPTEINVEFGAKQVPGNNKVGQSVNYSINYKYYDKSAIVNKPILYSTLDEVAEDHGIGSEAYNIARYFLSPEYGNAPFVELVAVSEDSPAGYQQALEVLKGEFVHLIFATYWDMNLFDAMYQHALTLSDPATGQRERYVVFASQNGWQWFSLEVKEFLEHFRALEQKGKRGFFVIFDGGEITLDTWIERDGSVTTNKKVILDTGEDITPLFGAMIAFARYCSFRDPATSLTEKSFAGINFVNKGWGDDVYLYLRDKGAFVIRNDFGTPVVDLDINMCYGLLGLNDSQLPIAMTEDWMKQDLRNKLKIFRGKKNIEVPSSSVINYLKLILDNYVMSGLITSYVENSIKVEILSSGLLKGYFRYTPIIIINQILFEYDFEFIV